MNWRDMLDDGLVLDGLVNTIHVLANHPAWAGVLGYTLPARAGLTLSRVVVRHPPWETALSDDVDEWSDWDEWSDTMRTAEWFARVLGWRPTNAAIETAIAAVASACERGR